MPVSLDLPRNYGRDGLPLDEEVRETWRERGEYVDMVRTAEVEGGDNLLSSFLGSERSKTVAYSYGAYTSIMYWEVGYI